MERYLTLILLSQQEALGGLSSYLAYGAWNEAEDVLVTSAGAELVLVDPNPNTTAVKARRLTGRAVRRIAGQSVMLPTLKSSPRDVRGANVIFLAYGPWDLPVLERIKELRRHADSVSLWMPEVWPRLLRDERLKFEGYDMLDHIFVGVEEAVEPFRAIAPSATIRYVPPATDVVLFGAHDLDRPRGIDVLGIGRRDTEQHSTIMDWAERNGKLYLYDTLHGSAASWREHRENLASWYRHSKVAMCNYAKHDETPLVEDLRVIPSRLFEGLAAGAVLVGMSPSERDQRDLLGMSVVESTDDYEVTALLDKYGSETDARDLRYRNAAMACRGHDWAHRWRTILHEIGLPEPVGVTERIHSLAARADEIEAGR